MFGQLDDTFTRDDLQGQLTANGVTPPLKNVVYRWRLLGCIDTLEVDDTKRAIKFKKVKGGR